MGRGLKSYGDQLRQASQPRSLSHNSAFVALRARVAMLAVALIWAVLGAACAVADSVATDLRTVRIFAQPMDAGGADASPPPLPSPLASVSFDMSALSLVSVDSYDAPELPESAKLVRLGLYDDTSAQWIAGTTVAAADNFRKSFSPHILLVVDSGGHVVSAACKGVAIDAGHTRDFGPQLIVLPETAGPQPQLNKPVVLSAEGKKVEPEQEKTFLKKYWWMIAIAVFLALSGGGGEK